MGRECDRDGLHATARQGHVHTVTARRRGARTEPARHVAYGVLHAKTERDTPCAQHELLAARGDGGIVPGCAGPTLGSTTKSLLEDVHGIALAAMAPGHVTERHPAALGTFIRC